MQSRWFKGLDDTQKGELRSTLLLSNFVFSRLSKLIQEDLDACIKGQESKDRYESPVWAYLQADYIGKIRAYKEILRLINIKESK